MKMPEYFKTVIDFINQIFLPGTVLYYSVWSLVLAVVSVTIYLVMKRLILRFVHAAFLRSSGKWDDLLVEHGVLSPVALLAPAIFLHNAFKYLPSFPEFLTHLFYPFVLFIMALTLDRLMSVGVAIYERYPVAQRYPIRGYVQIVKIVLYLAVAIIIVCYLLGQSPWAFLSGLGALTALILLIFKDTILSFVASVQIVMNDLVRVGDWIEVPQYNADGDVIEIALYTIKVQNWDKTITTIPTYKLIEGSFKNWRGMKQAGGRRIKRSVLIDKRSIRFLSEKDIERLRKIQILKPYIDAKLKELDEYNRVHDIDDSVLVNGRRMTNIGTFRAYLVEYLKQHPKIRKDMTFLVRQLPPSPDGLPLEIYVFSRDIVWANYEAIQADIFDHLLACVPEFGLRVYQRPSGNDIELLSSFITEDTGDSV